MAQAVSDRFTPQVKDAWSPLQRALALKTRTIVTLPALELRDAETAVAGLPLAEGRIRNAVLAADILHRYPLRSASFRIATICASAYLDRFIRVSRATDYQRLKEMA